MKKIMIISSILVLCFALIYAQDQAQTEEDTYAIMIGDANGDGTINIGDAVYIITYLYRNGPAPITVEQLYWNKFCQAEEKINLINEKIDSLLAKMDTLTAMQEYLQNSITFELLTNPAWPWWIDEDNPVDSLTDSL